MAAYGLEAAHCDIGVFGQEKVLIVTRFDRKKAENGNYWLRLPQEDMCQAMGTPPSLKYESHGGPGMKEILELLRGSSQSEHDRYGFFKTHILFWMLAAIDGHAKNFSIFHEPGNAYRMTPLYDVLSAWPAIGTGASKLSPYDVKMAMAWRAKNPHYRHHEIQRRHFNEIAAKLGIGKDAENILHEILTATPQVIQSVKAKLPNNFPSDVSTPVFDGITRSAELLGR
jgi:serine/threonine-protein kinase HipA